MKKCFCFLSAALFIITLTFTYSQTDYKAAIDSNTNIINTTKQDTAKIKAYARIAVTYQFIDPRKGLEYSKKAIQLAGRVKWNYGLSAGWEAAGINHSLIGNYDSALYYYDLQLEMNKKLKDKRGIIAAYNNIALLSLDQGSNAKALDYLNRALNLANEIKDEEKQAGSLSNLAMVYNSQGNFNKALDYFTKASLIYKKFGDKKKLANCYLNMGALQLEVKNYSQAVSNLFNSLKFAEQLGDLLTISMIYNNLASTYKELKNLDSALFYYQKAMVLKEKMNDKRGLAKCCLNIAYCYLELENFDESFVYFNRSYDLNKSLNNTRGLSYSLSGIGYFYFKKGMFLDSAKAASKGTINELYNKSETFYLKAINYAQSIGLADNLVDLYETLSAVYEKQGSWHNSLEYYKKFKYIYDSIYSADKAKEFTAIDDNYKYAEKELRAKIQLDNEQKEKARRNLTQYTGISILVLALFIVLFVLFRFEVTPKMIDGVIFLTFLVLYEFITLLLDPWIDNITQNIPVFKLLINISIAVVFIPLNFIEKKVRLLYFSKFNIAQIQQV